MAKYQGRTVKLNKPFRTPGERKKFAVYVKNRSTGNVKKVRFGDPNMKIKKTIPLETFVSNDDKFQFHTYLCLVDNEFIPILNNEHDGYAWVSFTKWPKPLHHGLRNTLQNKTNQLKLETVFKLIELL